MQPARLTLHQWQPTRRRSADALKSDRLPADASLVDVPVGQAAGVSLRRERRWGVLGGLAGALAGVGAFLVAWRVQGIPLGGLGGGAYPPVFGRQAMIPLDYYFLGLIGLGLVLLEGAVLALRRSRYPRTDGIGAVILGTLLCALGGVVLFIRLWAVVHR